MRRLEDDGYKNQLLFQYITNSKSHGTAVASIGPTAFGREVYHD
jgi:hypothetical protein